MPATAAASPPRPRNKFRPQVTPKKSAVTLSSATLLATPLPVQTQGASSKLAIDLQPAVAADTTPNRNRGFPLTESGQTHVNTPNDGSLLGEP